MSFSRRLRKRKTSPRRPRSARQLQIEPLESRQLLASMSGAVFLDTNSNGIFDALQGERGLADRIVYLDTNDNGQLDATGQYAVEPDQFLVGDVLDNVHPLVVLSGTNTNNLPAFDITAREDPEASTGRQVFNFSFNFNQRLRMDFKQLVSALRLDFIGGSASAQEYGRLEVYDANDSLLAGYDSRGLLDAEVDTMLVNRPLADIAYAIAYSPQNQGNFGRLDNLQFNTSGNLEPQLRTDPTGAYQFIGLTPGQKHLRLLPQPGTTQLSPVANQPGSVLIPVTGPVDHVFDPYRHLLYISTDHGTVERYDVNARQLLTPFQVGVSPGGIDITSDGKFLYVCEQQPGQTNSFVRKIDLESGQITDLRFPRDGEEAGAFDIAVASSGKAFVTTLSNGTNRVPLRQINLGNDLVSEVVNTPGVNDNGVDKIRPGTHVARNATGSRLVFTEGDSGDVWTYDSQADAFTEPPRGTAGTLVDANLAVSRDGQTVAVQSAAGGLDLLNAITLQTTRDNVGAFEGGVVFSPTLDTLYAIDAAADQLVAVSLTNFTEQFRTNLGENLVVPSGGRHNPLSIAPDGGLLFATTPSGVRMYFVNAADDRFAALTAITNLANMNFGVAFTALPLVRDDVIQLTSQTFAELLVLKNDVGDNLTITSFTPTSLGGSVFITGGRKRLFYFAPNGVTSGRDTFRYTARDAAGNVDDGLVTIILGKSVGQITGTVFDDRNANGQLDVGGGDGALAGRTVFIDQNGDGLYSVTSSRVEPDDYSDVRFENVLNLVNPRVRLSGANSSNQPQFKITANANTVTSTGTNVFGVFDIPYFNSSQRLRMDFREPVSTVTIDYINGDFNRTTFGQLRTYDFQNNLVGQFVTQGVAYAEIATMTVNRPQADIAYAVAYGSGFFSHLDALRFGGPERSATTDASGAYTFSNVPAGPVTVLARPEGGYRQTSPRDLGNEFFLDFPDRRDLIFDPVQSILYVSRASGKIERFDLTTRTLLTPIDLGAELTAIDITPDGNFLIVGQATVSGGVGTVRVVDTRTTVATAVSYTLQGSEQGVFDVVAIDNAKAFFTTSVAGGGTVSLHVLDLTNNAVTTRTDVPGGSLQSNTRITRGNNRGVLLFTQPGDSTGPLFTYNVANDTFSTPTTTGNLLDGANVAVSPDGSRLALETAVNGLSILDGTFNTLSVLPHGRVGLAFDPLGKLLWVGDEQTDELVAYDVTTLAEKIRFPLGEDFTVPATGPGVYVPLSISSDGRRLFLATPTGVRMYSLTGEMGYSFDLQAATTVSNIDFGKQSMGTNRAPVANPDSYATDEDVPLVIAAAGVLSNDADPDDNPLTAVLRTGPTRGTLQLSTNGSFTYTPQPNYTGPDSFVYAARDGALLSTNQTVTLTVNVLNDAPILTPAQPAKTFHLPAAVTYTVSQFVNAGANTTQITDADPGASVGGIAVTGLSGSGIWSFSLDGSTFSDFTAVADTSAKLLPFTALVRYTPGTVVVETGTLSFRAWDASVSVAGDQANASVNGGASEFSVAADTLSVTTAYNSAPVLTPSQPSIGSITEDAQYIAPLRDWVSGITDQDPGAAIGGLAITGFTGRGTWASSLDGLSFANFPPLSDLSALLLPAAAYLRYTPDRQNGETPTLTYRAWDSSGGLPGTTSDTTTNGSPTPFSSAKDTATLTVLSVNDAPLLPLTNPSLGQIKLLNQFTAIVGNLAPGISDVDAGAQLGGLAVTGSTGVGQWSYSADGQTFVNLPPVSPDSALLLPSTYRLRYTPNINAAETATISYRAWDQTDGAAGGFGDANINGATTAYSAGLDTATLTLLEINRAPVVTLPSGALGYSEGDPDRPLDSAATITDLDSPDFAGGSLAVRVLSGQTPTDEITIAATTNIVLIGQNIFYNDGVSTRLIGSQFGGHQGTDLIVNFTTTDASPAAAQALLRAIRYVNTSNNLVLADLNVRVTAIDGDGDLDTGTADKLIRIFAVNDPPRVQLATAPLSYTENAAATPIDSFATVSDPDSPDFSGGSLRVGFTSGGTTDDRLAITQASGVSTVGANVFVSGVQIGTFSGGLAGSDLVVNFTATAANANTVQAVLRAVTYQNTSDAPSTTPRVVRASINDNDGGNQVGFGQRTIQVTAVNDPPDVTIVTSNASYVEGAPVLRLGTGATITELDSNDFDGGSLSVAYVSGGSGGDQLALAVGGPVSVVGSAVKYDAGGGPVDIGTLNGGQNGGTMQVFFNSTNATRAAVEAVLQAVTFTNSSNDPVPGPRVLQVTVVDGDGGNDRDTAQRTVTVSAVNTPPNVVLPGTPTNYVEGQPPQPIDGRGSVSDPDSRDFSGGLFTASFFSGGTAADRLSFVNRNGISTSGNFVLLNGTAIGSYSGGAAGSDLIVNLNAGANSDTVSTLLRAVAFDNTSLRPDTTPRIVEFAVSDGDGGTDRGFARQTVNVTSVNQPPRVTASADSLFYTENAAPQLLDPNLILADDDSPDFGGGSLRVTLVQGGTASDQLSLANRGGITFLPSTGGVSFNGVVIGQASGGVNGGDLVVDFNASASLAAVEAAARAVTFADSSESPSLVHRSAQFTFNDGDGGNAIGSGSRFVVVNAVNDRPVVAPSANATNYTEGSAPRLIDSTIRITDDDSPDFNGGLISVAITNNADAGDRLALQLGGEITLQGANVQFTRSGVPLVIGSLVTSLDGRSIGVDFSNRPATPAATEAFARAITFESTSAQPSSAPRTISFTVDDGDGGVTTATQTVSVTQVNSPPTVDLNGPNTGANFTATWVQGQGSATLADSRATIVDPDSAIASVTATIVGALDGARETLAVGPVGSPFSPVYNSQTATLSIVAATPQPAAAFEAVLRTLSYQNTSSQPTGTGRTIQVTASDGTATSIAVTASVMFSLDDDTDGVHDPVENAGPNGGDGNRDGVLDSLQDHVTSLPTADGADYVSLASPAGTDLTNVTVTATNPSPDNDPVGVEYPLGFFDFAVANVTPGGSAIVTLFLPKPNEVNGYFVFGPTPDNRTPHWFAFSFDGTTGAEIFADRVVLHYVDGARGDLDLMVNGVIRNPGAPIIANLHPWQNPFNRFDVNGDGEITPQDALVLINHLNTFRAHSLAVPPVPPNIPPPYLDVSGNDEVSALDVLQVIDFLNQRATSRLVAQGEPTDAVIPTRDESVYATPSEPSPATSRTPKVQERRVEATNPVVSLAGPSGTLFTEQPDFRSRAELATAVDLGLDDFAEDVASAWR